MATLYDSNGNPIDLGRLREEVSAPGLLSIRSPFTEHPSQGLTPQKLARLLRASEQGEPGPYLALAEEMEEKDLAYRAQLGTRKQACAGLELVVEAASDAKPDQVAADLVRDVLGREDFEDTLLDILDALGKGFSVSEIVWDVSGKDWRPARVEHREPGWFSFDQTDGRTVRLREAAGLVPLDPFKFIVHTPKLKSGLPIRAGFARAAAWAYLFGNYALKDWVAFAEVFGQPLRLGKYPAGSAQEQIEILERAVRGIGSDAAAVVPDGMVIEFVKTDASGNGDLYEKLLRFLDGRVTLAVLGQNLTSGQTQGGGGSLALGQVHNQVRMDLMRSDARQLMASVARDLVRPLVDLNLGPQASYPKIRLHIPQPQDIAGLVAALKELVPLGLEVEQSVVRDKLGLPDPPKGKDVVLLKARQPEPPAIPPEPPAQAGQPQGDPAQAAATAAHAQMGNPEPDALDRLADQALSDWIPQMKPLADPLIQAIERAQDFDGLKAALSQAAQSMDPAVLGEQLAKASFVATLAGGAGVDLAD